MKKKTLGLCVTCVLYIIWQFWSIFLDRWLDLHLRIFWGVNYLLLKYISSFFDMYYLCSCRIQFRVPAFSVVHIYFYRFDIAQKSNGKCDDSLNIEVKNQTKVEFCGQDMMNKTMPIPIDSSIPQWLILSFRVNGNDFKGEGFILHFYAHLEAIEPSTITTRTTLDNNFINY